MPCEGFVFVLITASLAWLWILSQMSAGSDSLWQHDERNLGSSWRAVQSKHRTVCFTEEHPAGIIIADVVVKL